MKRIRKQSHKPRRLLVAGGLIFVSALVAPAVGQNPLKQPMQAGETICQPAEGVPTLHCDGNGESLAPTVKRVAPAVVKIETVRAIGSFAGRPGEGSEDPPSRFFLGQMPRQCFRLPLLHGIGSMVSS